MDLICVFVLVTPLLCIPLTPLVVGVSGEAMARDLTARQRCRVEALSKLKVFDVLN